ncbi:MAG TPA: PilN domain-containing protein [Stellaceae bacterium]|nr:PilN domain-containing protein [Stellaceae bacterium]
MVRDFLNWWLEQLAELLPRSWRRSVAASDDALVLSPLAPLGRGVEEVAAGLRRNGKETPLGSFGLGAAALGRLPQPAGGAYVLRLSGRDVLAKTLTLPLAAQADLSQVLAFEMDRETPFKAEEIYWSHRVAAVERDSGQLSVRLLLVTKASLAPLLAALGEAGIVPRRAEIADGPDSGATLPLDGNGGHLGRASRRLVRPLAACCALLALVAIATPFVRQALMLSTLDRQIAAARAQASEAGELRRAVVRLSAGAALIPEERQKATHPLAVLAAATRVLPDDTYLSELELRGGKVTLSGRSHAAARLIGALAAAGAFHNPAFAAPVTRLEALHAEVFTIAAEVGP